MLTKTAVEHFGTKMAVAAAAGISRASVSGWGPVVPYLSAMRLQEASGFRVRLDPALYTARGKPRKDVA